MCDRDATREAVYLGVIAVLWAALLVVACRRPPPPPPVMPIVPLSVLRDIDSASTDTDDDVSNQTGAAESFNC